MHNNESVKSLECPLLRPDAVLHQVHAVLGEVLQGLPAGQRQDPGQPGAEPHHHDAQDQAGHGEDQQAGDQTRGGIQVFGPPCILTESALLATSLAISVSILAHTMCQSILILKDTPFP